jgi:hypothetical protein
MNITTISTLMFEIMILVILFSLIVHAPLPEPRGIAGYVHTSAANTTQVPAGTNFKVNNTNSGDFVKDVTGIGPFPGRYSVVINGNDGNTVIISAWNSTSYGKRTITLAGDMDNINLSLFFIRPPELNVTIIYPNNNPLFNITTYFNITVNVTNIGGQNGSYCNVTLSVSNSTVLILATGETLLHQLGNITVGQTNTTKWLVSGNRTGSVNVTAAGICGPMGENFDEVSIARISNITIQDIFAPNITLLSPANNSLNDTTVTISFFYNISDASLILNCSLVLNNQINATNYAVARNTLLNFTLTLTNGQYNWSINCTDEALNIGASGTRNLTISLPDLEITAQDIVFIPSEPHENETIVVNATVHNRGTKAASNFIVEFYDGDPDSSGVQIYNETVSIGALTNVSVNTTWIARMGYNNIFVRVDKNNSIIEVNKNNNNANNYFLVSIWQVYYGNVSGRILLDTAVNYSISMWTDVYATNLFVVKTGSAVVWSSLLAIGRNSDAGQEMNDFVDIDTALNTANYTDSVNRSFTYNSNPKHLENFTIYNLQIQNVSVINSTITSNFITGILWDTSDGDSEYDGTQDLVFITKINQQKQGKYGTYDYEIAVPAKLRDYKYSEFNTLTFYVEIK